MDKVNSHTEWGKLKEVIIGDIFNFDMTRIDISSKLFYYDNIFRQLTDELVATPQKYVDEMKEDIDNFAEVLKQQGISVKRPQLINKIQPFKTPYWSGSCAPPISARDLVMIVGDTIIETPVCLRDRFFETDCYKSIFYNYFKNGSRWISAPRPMLLDTSFDLSYIEQSENYDPMLFVQQEHAYDNVGYEISFDAAQCMRLGTDIIFNSSNQNHHYGAKWLQQTLGDTYNVHEVNITDNHIDTCLLPLKPGVFLINPYRMRSLDVLPECFRSWKMIEMPDIEGLDKSRYYRGGELLIASEYIDCNVFCIDDETIVVNSLCPSLIRVLEKNGFIVIPVQMRHSRLFGAGFHCLTLDTYRDETLETYT